MDFKVKGIIVPTLTPFDGGGKIDATAVERLVDFLIGNGVAGLFPGGTTGEGFLLSLEERRQVAEAVVSAAAGKVPVIVHTGTPTTSDTMALTQHAAEIGAGAAGIIAPYVYHHGDESLFRHFSCVANSVPQLPIYLYNFPAICNNTLSTDLVQKVMAEAPNVIGMKDSSGSLETLARLVAATDGYFNAINGGDGQALMALAMGFDGCVSGNANVVPELMVSLYNAVEGGDLKSARPIQQKINRVRALLGDGGNLSLFKGMLTRRGIPVGDVRPPLPAEPAESLERIWQELVEYSVF